MGLTEKPAWRQLEEIVEAIYKSLSGGAEVKRDERIRGRSGVDRQIDVSIRHKVAGHTLLIVVEAKNYKKKVSISKVDAFATVIQDVGASKGVLISDSGFTRGAQKQATSRGIDLCTAHDAKTRPWSSDLTIPVFLEQHKVRVWLSYALTAPRDSSQGGQLTVSEMLSSDRGGTCWNWREEFCRRWNSRVIPRTAGKHVVSVDERLFALVDMKLWLPVTGIRLTYTVAAEKWFKRLSPTDYHGLKNIIQDTAEITITYNVPMATFIRDSSWILIDDEGSLAVSPVGFIIRVEYGFSPDQFTSIPPPIPPRRA